MEVWINICITLSIKSTIVAKIAYHKLAGFIWVSISPGNYLKAHQIQKLLAEISPVTVDHIVETIVK